MTYQSSGMSGDRQRQGVTATAQDMRTRNVISADDLNGATIYGSDNDEIGTIDDIYLDIDEHTARWVSADVGGFLGIGAKTVLIPFENLQWTDRGLYLPVERQVLEDAPEFDPDDIHDRQYEERVGRAWGVDPYWTEDEYGTRHSHRRDEGL